MSTVPIQFWIERQFPMLADVKTCFLGRSGAAGSRRERWALARGGGDLIHCRDDVVVEDR